MKVILFEENRIAEVADGYARNFLFPKRLAVLATAPNISKFEKKMKEKESELEQKRKDAQELAKKLETQVIIIKADASEEGKLFGSVTSSDVIRAIAEQAGAQFDKRKVNLNEHIKMLGEYEISIKLHHDVTAHVKIKVEKNQE